MNTAEDVWHRKTDYELGVAALTLDEYTDEGQRVILAEIQRRQLEKGSATEINVGTLPVDEPPTPSDRVQRGMLWIAGGVVVTVGTYLVAASIGGRYLIAWGPIVYGIVQFVRGLGTPASAQHKIADGLDAAVPHARPNIPSIRSTPVTEVSCWSCKQPLPVTLATRGKKVTCTGCGTRQSLPR